MSNGSVTKSLLIITGTMGAGKTTVLCEASDILALRQIPHAAIDLDALGLCRGIVSTTSTVICRLTASLETMQLRIQKRESGVSRQEYVARVAALNAVLDRACLEDFTITNENRSVTEVAYEMLFKAKWISS